MSRWSERRGQTEPLAAIAAVFVVGAGLAVYAGVLGDALPGSADRNVARPTLDRAESAVERNGVVDPDGFDAVGAVGPDGYAVNATLETSTDRWCVGPRTPPDAATASERVSVRVDAGRVRPGRLVVRVWR